MSGTKRLLGAVGIIIIESMGHFGNVDIRMSKPVENLHKNLFESNREYARKQVLDRLR